MQDDFALLSALVANIERARPQIWILHSMLRSIGLRLGQDVKQFIFNTSFEFVHRVNNV